MTNEEFVSELADISSVFEKRVNDALLAVLYDKLGDLAIPEFRAIKTRAIEECDFFPKVSKWLSLREWVLAKRPKQKRGEHFPCPRCGGTGEIEAKCRRNLFTDEWHSKFTNYWAGSQTHGDVFLERHGRDTTGVMFAFICTCENGKRYQGKAKERWTADCMRNYEPVFAQEWVPTKEQVATMKALGVETLLKWAMGGEDVALNLERETQRRKNCTP